MGYTVGEVAQWSGVTVRTLHHYEHIALLSPAARSSSGYSAYDNADLERLQQILFYRELGFSLDHIAAVLASPKDAVEHLAYQRGLLLDRIQRLQGLVAAIEQAMEAQTMGTTPTPAERFAALNERKTNHPFRRAARLSYLPGAQCRDDPARTRRATDRHWQFPRPERRHRRRHRLC